MPDPFAATLRDILTAGTTEGRHPLADKIDICLAQGHDFVWSHDIWVICERCGCQTPGSIDD